MVETSLLQIGHKLLEAHDLLSTPASHTATNVAIANRLSQRHFIKQIMLVLNALYCSEGSALATKTGVLPFDDQFDTLHAYD